MEMPKSLRSIVLAAIIMVPAGTLGHAQDYVFEDDPYSDPSYDPQFDSYAYDPYWNNELGLENEDLTLTDDELRRRIKGDLYMSPFVHEQHVHVAVQHGVATLDGSVEDRSAMVDAVEIAYEAGAWKVRNRLRLRESGNPQWAVELSDMELKKEIMNELAMSPFVNSDQITVTVRNGVATLTGGVENRGEIADAVENAYEAGAKRVKSELWIDPDLS